MPTELAAMDERQKRIDFMQDEPEELEKRHWPAAEGSRRRARARLGHPGRPEPRAASRDDAGRELCAARAGRARRDVRREARRDAGLLAAARADQRAFGHAELGRGARADAPGRRARLAQRRQHVGEQIALMVDGVGWFIVSQQYLRPQRR